MKIIYIILTFILFPTVLFSQNNTLRIKQSPIKYITIKGQVIDIKGKPLSNIRITGEFKNNNIHGVYSNKNGKFKIKVNENSKITFHYCDGYNDTIFLAKDLKTNKQIIYDYRHCNCEMTCIRGSNLKLPFFIISYEYTTKYFPFGINIGINNYKNIYLFNSTSLQYNQLTDFKNNNEIKLTFSGIKYNLPFDFTLVNENYYKFQRIYFNNTQNNIHTFRTKLELKNKYFYVVQPRIGLIYNKYNVLYNENFGVSGALNFRTKKYNSYFDISAIFFKNFIENEFKFTKIIPNNFNLELIYKRNRFYNGYSLRIIYKFYKNSY